MTSEPRSKLSARTLVGILLPALATLLGCANWSDRASLEAKNQDGHCEEEFLHSLRELKRTRTIPLSPLLTMNAAYYWMPASVERLLEEGEKAVPVLRRLEFSGDFVQRHYAEACLDILEARVLRKGKSLPEDGTGVEVRCYEVCFPPSD